MAFSICNIALSLRALNLVPGNKLVYSSLGKEHLFYSQISVDALFYFVGFRPYRLFPIHFGILTDALCQVCARFCWNR